jgi:putative membrane protein
MNSPALSPEVQAFSQGFPLTLLHAGLTILLLVAGAAVYALLTPHKELSLVRAGNTAAAVSFGGVLVGLAIPLAVSLGASTSLLEIGVWGVSTIVVQLFVFRIADLVLRGLPRRIAAGETAAATLLVAAKLAVAVILAAAVAG